MKTRLTFNTFWLGIRYCRFAHVLRLSIIPFLEIQITLPGDPIDEIRDSAYWRARL